MSMLGSDPSTVWTYGSYARGDFDQLSDVDILVVGSPPEGCERAFPKGHSVSVSRYTWQEVEAMTAYGSLFLQHIKLEGKPMLEVAGGHARLQRLLDSLGSYQLFRRDIAAFRSTVCDVQEARIAGSTPEFELSVLGTVARHASVLACYLLGAPCFSRTGAAEQAARAFGFPAKDALGLCGLYRFRLHEDGRCGMPYQASWTDVERWAQKVLDFVCRVEELADAFEGRLSNTYRESAGKRD